MDARIFQEAIRSATVTYPIPFIFCVLLLFSLLCLGGSLIANDWLRVLFASLGGASFVSAISTIAYTIRARPELLRSEQHVQRMAIAHIIGDKEMDPVMRDDLSRTLLDRGDQLRPKNLGSDRSINPPEDKERADD